MDIRDKDHTWQNYSDIQINLNILFFIVTEMTNAQGFLDEIIINIKTSIATGIDVSSVKFCETLCNPPFLMNERGKCNMYVERPELKEAYICPYLKKEDRCGKDSRTPLGKNYLTYA